MRFQSPYVRPVLLSLVLLASAAAGCEGPPDVPREDLGPAARAAFRSALRATETRVPFVEHAGSITCAEFDAAGARVVTGSRDGTVRVWTAEGDPLLLLEGHVAPIESARFSPDDGLLVSTSADGTARIWSREGAEVAVLRGHAAAVVDARWSPSGAHLATLSLSGDVRLWDRAGAAVAGLAPIDFAASSFSFSPDGGRVLSVSRSRGEARVTDLDGAVTATLRGPGEALEAAAFSPAGERLVWAPAEGTAHIVARDGTTVASLGGHDAQVLAIAVAPSGRRLVTASLDGTALLRTGSGELLAPLRGHTAAVHSVAFLPRSERVLTVSTDRTARLWDTDGAAVATLGGSQHRVRAALVSPDGRTALTLADGDPGARLWNIDGDHLDTLLPAEGERIVRARYAPGGQRVLTLSSGATARTWLVHGADLAARADGLAPGPENADAPAAARSARAPRTPPGEFAGTSSCARCHRAEYELWANSTHARSTEPASAENLPRAVVAGDAVDHAPGRTDFRVSGSVHVARTVGADGELHDFPVTHVVGRKRVQMLVTTLADGRLQVLPAMCELGDETWFDYTHLLFGAPGDGWERPPVVAPGEASFWEGFVRSFDARCASCHTSGYEPRAPGEDGVGPRSTWRAMGVDCEACHGPGRAHADAWDRSETGDVLPRLGELGRDALTGVCTQCHMEAESVLREHRIGADVYESRDPTLLLDPERVDPTGRPLELIYDGLPFASSHCAESGGLTCVDCHEPHGSHERSQLRGSPDDGGLCAGCHAEQVRDARGHAHHDAQGTATRCVACHMPFLTIERGHGTVADHTIGVPRLDQAGDRVARDACRWCHQGARDAPLVSPPLDDDALRAAYARWWPDARGARPWMAALGAARAGHEDAGAGLLAAVRDAGNPRVVRASAARLLERYADGRVDDILELSRERDTLVRRSAVAALAGVAGPRTDERLLEALEDPSPGVRQAAARAAIAGWSRIRANAPLRSAVTGILQEEVDRLPEDSRRWFRLGAVLGISGDRRGALAAYEQMLELDPFANAVRRHVERLRHELATEERDP